MDAKTSKHCTGCSWYVEDFGVPSPYNHCDLFDNDLAYDKVGPVRCQTCLNAPTLGTLVDSINTARELVHVIRVNLKEIDEKLKPLDKEAGHGG